jgi:peptidyl-tRNA hydrolase
LFYNHYKAKIVGLGNPDPIYSKTRHNVGKMIVSEVVKELSVKMIEQSCGAIGFFEKNNEPTVAFYLT